MKPPSSEALYGVAGVGLLVVLGVVVARLPVYGPTEVGRLDPVFAQPAEVVEVHQLGSGQTFGEVLSRASLDADEQRSLLLAFREQASPRRMRSGTEITVRRARQGGSLRAVDVALSADETVRLNRDPVGWTSQTIRTPVWTDTLYASGTIEDVLWTAVVTDPDLADVPRQDRALLIHQLDQIFQWQIDFSRQIQPGDYYRMVFERQVRPDGTMRSGHVLAAELVNQGRSYEALFFDPNGDGEGTYYDQEGKSVRRAFMRKPLEFRRISSTVRRRYHPILKRWRAHNGVDYVADRGTPVQATGDGVVVRRGPWGGYGNAVEIRHPNGFTTRYGHLSGFRAGVVVGSRVKQGEVIGYVGATGLATAPHLHYEMRRGGKILDPLSIRLPAGDPVPDDEWDAWSEQRRQDLFLLSNLPEAPATRMAATDAAPAETQSSQGGS